MPWLRIITNSGGVFPVEALRRYRELLPGSAPLPPAQEVARFHNFRILGWMAVTDAKTRDERRSDVELAAAESGHAFAHSQTRRCGQRPILRQRRGASIRGSTHDERRSRGRVVVARAVAALAVGDR